MNIPPKYEDFVAQLEAERVRADVAVSDCNDAERRESALREELSGANEQLRMKSLWIAKLIPERDDLQQRLAVAEQRAEMLEREFKKLRDVAHDCYQIASSYSGCIDGVEESGGDDHDDPSCAIFHRLYYAMFDADAALKPAEEDDSDLQKIGFVRMNTKTDQPRISLADMHARYDRKPCQEPQAHPTRCGCEDLSHDQ